MTCLHTDFLVYKSYSIYTNYGICVLTCRLALNVMTCRHVLSLNKCNLCRCYSSCRHGNLCVNMSFIPKCHDISTHIVVDKSTTYQHMIYRVKRHVDTRNPLSTRALTRTDSHNNASHNKTVCLFYGTLCTSCHGQAAFKCNNFVVIPFLTC